MWCLVLPHIYELPSGDGHKSMMFDSWPPSNPTESSRNIKRSLLERRKSRNIFGIDNLECLLTARSSREGLRDINELKEAYKDKIQNLKKNASIPIPIPSTAPQSSASSSPFPPPPSPPQIPAEKLPPSTKGIKTLSAYLDLEKTRALPQKELEAIWRLRHVNDAQSLCAVIPIEVYKTLEATAKKHPHFILPLPKEGQGAEIHFLQWTFPAENTVTVLFTHLAEFKLRVEFSQPHTTITHHLELAEDKGVVLLQGQVVEGRGVSVDEAKWLVMCLQKFYGFGGEKSERKRLLELFGKGDAAFKIEDLVEEAEKIV